MSSAATCGGMPLPATGSERLSWAVLVLLALAVADAWYLNAVWTGLSPLTAFTLAVCVVVGTCTGAAGSTVRAGLVRTRAMVAYGSTRQFLAGAIAAGLVLRIAWLAAVPPVQRSDMAAYFNLGQRLVAGHGYGFEQARAFWPPGLPYSLALTMWLTGLRQWAPALNNLLLFVVCVLVVHAFARHIAGVQAARLGVALVVVWPNWILLSGLASKELLLVPLVSGSILVYLRYATRTSGAAAAAGSGALLGVASLAQPSFLLVAPLMVGSYELQRGLRVSRIGGRIAAAAGAAMLVVAPWTIRNYRVLGAFVPVTSTSGLVLWVANNPDATGLWIPTPQWLAGVDELTADRLGRQTALAWIGGHPARFAALAVRKQMLFWADDAKGAYETLRRDLAMTRGYAIAKTVSNACWLALLAVMLSIAAGVVRTRGGLPPELAAVVAPIVYDTLLHTIVESDGRFHTPLMGLIAVLAVCLAARLEVGERRAAATPGRSRLAAAASSFAAC